MAIISLSPESASWLVSKAKFEEAKKAFRWVRGEGDVQDEELEAMITSQKEEQKTELQRKEIKKFTCNGMFKAGIDTIKDTLRIFKRKEFYKPAIIAISMLVVFEFGGAHMFAAYGNIILQAVLNKDDAKDVAWQFTLIDLLRTVCALVAIFLLKYFKRRTILFSSGVLTVLSMSSISVFIYLRKAGFFSAPWLLDIVPMTLMIVYTLVFCLGLVPLNWVICGEVFPLAYRSFGSTLSTLFLTPSFMISMKTAPHLYSSVGVEGAFLVYSATLTVFLSIMYALLPETKDKTLQDIEDSFKGKKKEEHDVQMTLIDKEDIVVMK